MKALSRVLVLLRHGESVWNRANKFTGSVDVSLSKQGIVESVNAGVALRGIKFDRVFTSHLMRAQTTAILAISEQSEIEGLVWVSDSGVDNSTYGGLTIDNLIPIHVDRALGERVYGSLQGRDKSEVEKQLGSELFVSLRRGFNTRPPGGESLKDTADRVLPYFRENVIPALASGENVLLVAHGNSLRAIVMVLESISESAIVKTEMPTGGIICYRLLDNGWEKLSLDGINDG